MENNHTFTIEELRSRLRSAFEKVDDAMIKFASKLQNDIIDAPQSYFYDLRPFPACDTPKAEILLRHVLTVALNNCESIDRYLRTVSQVVDGREETLSYIRDARDLIAENVIPFNLKDADI